MGYHAANTGGGRRLGDMSSGPRTVGYDANPRGLTGTNSDIRSLAGTKNTASDYKKSKQKKDDKKKDKDKEQENYPPPEDEVPPEMKPPKPPAAEKQYEPESEPEYEGHGWDLLLTIDGKEKPEVFATSEMPPIGPADLIPSKFHIIRVEDGEPIKLPTAPLENGMVKHDHKVLEPRTLRVVGWVLRADTAEINANLKKAREARSLKTYFELHSPWKDYKKMYLKKSSSRISTEKYDVYEYTLELQELLIATSLTDTTSDPNLASNSAKGSAKGK